MAAMAASNGRRAGEENCLEDRGTEVEVNGRCNEMGCCPFETKGRGRLKIVPFLDALRKNAMEQKYPTQEFLERKMERQRIRREDGVFPQPSRGDQPKARINHDWKNGKRLGDADRPLDQESGYC